MGHNSSSAVFYLLGYPLSTVTKRIIAAIFIAIIWGIFRKILMFFGIFGRRSHFFPPTKFFGTNMLSNSTSTELEFWLEMLPRTTKPQNKKQHNRYPSSAQVITTSNSRKTSINPPSGRLHAIRIRYAELEFCHQPLPEPPTESRKYSLELMPQTCLWPALYSRMRATGSQMSG